MSELERIRTDIRCNLGRRVGLVTNRGRMRGNRLEGILKHAFSNVFLVEVSGGKACKTYTYGDVLTNSLEVNVLD